MKMIFKNPRIFQRTHAGPLGSSIESYAAEMRERSQSCFDPGSNSLQDDNKSREIQFQGRDNRNSC